MTIQKTVTDFLKAGRQTKPLILIGDTILDKTWYVNATKLSPEGPVPVAVINSVKPIVTTGGASLSACYATQNNIPILYITKADQEAKELFKTKSIEYKSIDTEHCISRLRYIDRKSNYHLIRIDNDLIVDKTPLTIEYLLETIDIETVIMESSGLLLLDYNKNVLIDEKLCQRLKNIAHKYEKKIYVDTRGSLKKFKGYDFIKLNESEAENGCKEMNVKEFDQLKQVLNCKNLLVTLGAEGAEIYSNNLSTSFHHSPNLENYSTVPDVTGCGDVFDVHFCYHHLIENNSLEETLIKSVDFATEFAYKPIYKRL